MTTKPLTGQTFSAMLGLGLLPDVLLLEISMSGDGLNAAHNVCPVVRVGMLTVSENDDDAMQAQKREAAESADEMMPLQVRNGYRFCGSDRGDV